MEMLLSKMPWYTVQYSSPVPHIKFIKEEWHFENKPIVVMMNPQGTVENKNALHLIRRRGMSAFPSTRRVQTSYSFSSNPASGPLAFQKYTFFYGGEDKRWIKQFSDSANVVVKHPVLENAQISIDLRRVAKSNDGNLTKYLGNFLLYSENKSKWVLLTKSKGSKRIVIDHGVTILNVLEEFEKWNMNVHKQNFEDCFKEYHGNILLQTRLLP